ncbi:hypothetical protein HanPSC8_Chr02g0079611 [Helianthus annuus]|nr:hypothetical protein HanPSC8_Chr02g0079611 [Helianthus annuus]
MMSDEEDNYLYSTLKVEPSRRTQTVRRMDSCLVKGLDRLSEGLSVDHNFHRRIHIYFEG